MTHDASDRSGSGICYEIGRQFLLHGCAGLIICGRRAGFLEKAADALNNSTAGIAAGAKCVYKTCDVRDPQQCVAVVKFAMSEFGHLDILVNGAAGNFLSEASALRPKGFKTVLEIDTMGTFHMCHAAFPHLTKSRFGGNVVNITATLQYGATWYQVHASAAKAAVDSMTRTMALEWGSPDINIRVNGIAPGPIANTPGTTKLAPGVDGDEVAEMVKEGIPLGRMGEASDIGMAAIYLCSGAGSYVTGAVLVVDGGEWLYRPPLVPRDMVAELSRKVEQKSRAQAPPTIASKL
jgi:peroxisomal 2,4-dienoyl-CoA reductase